MSFMSIIALECNVGIRKPTWVKSWDLWPLSYVLKLSQKRWRKKSHERNLWVLMYCTHCILICLAQIILLQNSNCSVILWQTKMDWTHYFGKEHTNAFKIKRCDHDLCYEMTYFPGCLKQGQATEMDIMVF